MLQAARVGPQNAKWVHDTPWCLHHHMHEPNHITWPVEAMALL